MFIVFCTHITIQAKEGSQKDGEEGENLVPFELIPTQVYLLDEILEGLRRGIHFFVVLKCRQSGTTTLGLAFELWWSFCHDGFNINFIADSVKRLAVNRATLVEMVDSIDDPEWKIPIKEDNKELLRFANRSKVIWNNANARDEGGLGRGVGAMGFHATEPGRYKNEEEWTAMMPGIARKNPSRFYLVEGTSEGPNLFKDIWDEASREGNVTQKAIFIGWWLHPDYDLDLETEEGKAVYQTYWVTYPRLSKKEAEWVQGVKDRFGYQITATQIAWWRYMVKEEFLGKEEKAYQEFPPLPEYAWIYGGSSFVSGNAIAVAKNKAKRSASSARYFQFEFGTDFHSTQIHRVNPAETWYDLVVWDHPKKSPFMRYAIGVDPAHGANELSDAAAIVVYECYSDQAVQVAEYSAVEETSYHLTWVLLYLAGAFKGPTIANIELQGGGFAIQDNLRLLQEQMLLGFSDKLTACFSDLQFYRFAPADSISRTHASYNWYTTPRKKEEMLHWHRDLFEQGLIEIRSADLIEQTAAVKKMRDGTLENPNNDHKLMAAAICGMAYKQILEMDIGGNENYTRTRVNMGYKNNAGTEEVKAAEVLEGRLLDWRLKLEQEMKEEREEAIEKAPEWMITMREAGNRFGDE